MNQGRKSADKVYAKLVGTAVECLNIWNVILSFTCACNEGNRCNRNSFVDDRNTKFLFNILTSLNKLAGLFHNLVVNFVAGTLAV